MFTQRLPSTNKRVKKPTHISKLKSSTPNILTQKSALSRRVLTLKSLSKSARSVSLNSRNNYFNSILLSSDMACNNGVKNGKHLRTINSMVNLQSLNNVVKPARESSNAYFMVEGTGKIQRKPFEEPNQALSNQVMENVESEIFLNPLPHHDKENNINNSNLSNATKPVNLHIFDSIKSFKNSSNRKIEEIQCSKITIKGNTEVGNKPIKRKIKIEPRDTLTVRTVRKSKGYSENVGLDGEKSIPALGSFSKNGVFGKLCEANQVQIQSKINHIKPYNSVTPSSPNFNFNINIEPPKPKKYETCQIQKEILQSFGPGEPIQVNESKKSYDSQYIVEEIHSKILSRHKKGLNS